MSIDEKIIHDLKGINNIEDFNEYRCDPSINERMGKNAQEDFTELTKIFKTKSKSSSLLEDYLIKKYGNDYYHILLIIYATLAIKRKSRSIKIMDFVYLFSPIIVYFLPIPLPSDLQLLQIISSIVLGLTTTSYFLSRLYYWIQLRNINNYYLAAILQIFAKNDLIYSKLKEDNTFYDLIKDEVESARNIIKKHAS